MTLYQILSSFPERTQSNAGVSLQQYHTNCMCQGEKIFTVWIEIEITTSRLKVQCSSNWTIQEGHTHPQSEIHPRISGPHIRHVTRLTKQCRQILRSHVGAFYEKNVQGQNGNRTHDFSFERRVLYQATQPEINYLSPTVYYRWFKCECLYTRNDALHCLIFQSDIIQCT